MKNKPVDDLMKLPYTVEITLDDGGYFAKIKELEGCMTVGDTTAAALAMIEDAKQARLTAAVEDGIEIPLPESMQAERYSGKFALRLPKSLHRQLAESAERDGVSLNQYLVTLLAERNALAAVKRQLTQTTPPPCELPEIEPKLIYTGANRKVLPFHRQQRVVGA
jgi:predicted RNase H-like HicB family nuclease